MKSDENDKLWKLLGNARQPDVSPFFSRNILRAIRQEEATQPVGPLEFLGKLGRAFNRWSWRFTIAGTCAAAVLISISPTAFHHHHVTEDNAGVTRAIVANPDYEVINHLDELVADEESSLWLDDNSSH